MPATLIIIAVAIILKRLAGEQGVAFFA